MTEPLTVQDSWGRQALDTRQAYERFQFSVKSGCDVSINTGTLGQTDTLSVASGTVYFNGSSVSVSSQNAQIDAANASHPRKDVVYIDTNGDAQVAKGTAEAQQPDKFDGDTWEETYRPAPEDLSSTNAVVLAEVWVGAGVSSLGANLSTASNAVRDRRLNADLVLNTLTTEQIGDGRHYAGAYSGADPDARLSNTISAASAGDVIYLENATYDSSLSISKVLSLIGVGQTGTPIEASWTATTGSCAFIGITLGTGGSINLDGIACHAERIYGQGATTVTAGGDRVGIYDSYNIDVTFDNGTSEGMADGLRGSSTVTDNGTNTAGDVT